jgi:hypothetical protein
MFTFTSNLTSRSSNTSDTQCSLDAKRILGECCEQLSACRFQLVHCEYSVHATFAATFPDYIELAVSSSESDEPIHPQAICCISFSYGTSYCAFLGCLIDVRLVQRGEYRVCATTPKQLTVTNLRQSFRVPVIEASGLETTVRNGKGEAFSVVAHDITEQGIEIEFPSGSHHNCSLRSMVNVELKFRGEVVHRMAQVRRVIGDRCGLAFEAPSDAAGQKQASCMRGIVLSLQQLWLRSRLL